MTLKQLTAAAACALCAAFSHSQTIEVDVQAGAGPETVRVPANPARVVTADDAALDTIAAWGLADRVVLSAEFKTLPWLADLEGRVPTAGGLKGMPLDAVKAARPDVIFITSRLAKDRAAYEAIAPVVLTSPDFERGALKSFETNLTALGRLFGHEADAERAIVDAHGRIAAIRQAAAGKTAAVALVTGGRVAALPPNGRGALISNEMGFTNLEAPRAPAKKGPKANGPAPSQADIDAANDLTLSRWVKARPDFIFIIDKDAATKGAAASKLDGILARESFKGDEGRVVRLTPAAWYLGEGGVQAMDLMIGDVEKALGLR